MTGLPVLDRGTLGAIAGLCSRSLRDPPSIDELDGTLFAPLQPAVIHGDPEVGVVATVAGVGGASAPTRRTACGRASRVRRPRSCASSSGITTNGPRRTST